MIIKNADNPEGKELKHRPTKVKLKPLTCRKLTPEERKKYGLLPERK